MTGTEQDGTAGRIAGICDAMKDLLLYKNGKYGNAALEPLGIFAKGNSMEGLAIRLDDKLARVKNNPNPVPYLNDLCDIIGYCVLMLVRLDASAGDIACFKD